MDYPAEKYNNAILKVMENLIREANREQISQQTYDGRVIIDVDALSETGHWFDVVLQNQESIRNFLYYLSGVPIIDAPWRLNLNAQEKSTVPCYCPFHKRFHDLNQCLGGNEFVDIIDKPCKKGTGIFSTIEGLSDHCVKQGDLKHHIFHSYLLSMHLTTMELVGFTMKKAKQGDYKVFSTKWTRHYMSVGQIKIQIGKQINKNILVLLYNNIL